MKVGEKNSKLTRLFLDVKEAVGPLSAAGEARSHCCEFASQEVDSYKQNNDATREGAAKGKRRLHAAIPPRRRNEGTCSRAL